MSSAEAPGREWERASRAVSSFARNSGETVRCSRTWLAVRGSTAIGRTGTSSAGATDGASLTPSGRRGSSGRTWSVPTLGARPTWDAEATGAGTVVTTVRAGGEATGQSSAAMTAASCLERRKKRGSTSARFSGVRTLESEAMVVRHRRPSLKGSRISGKRWMSVAAVMRKKAAALESPSSRWRKGKRPEWPSSSHPRRWSNSARAARKSAMACCSWRRREARRAARARLSVRFMREIIARPISRPVRRAGRPAGARGSRGGRSSRRSPSTWPSGRAARAGAASGGAPGRGRLARPDRVKRKPLNTQAGRQDSR